MSTLRSALTAAAFVVCATLKPGIAFGANQNETRLDVTLTPSLFAPSNAIGDASYEIRRHRKDFSIDVEDLPVGIYNVLIGGAYVGQLTMQAVSGGTEGRLAYSSQPTAAWEFNLGLDPRGKLIQISLGTTVFLSGTIPLSQNPEAPGDNPTFNNVVETVTAVSMQDGVRARGTLHLVSGGNHASLQFELQKLETLPHLITANGVNIGYFTPLAGGIARVRFSTDPGAGDRPLDFDPVDTTFLVILNDVEILEFRTGPNSSIGGGSTPIGETVQAFNASEAAPGATGTATLRDRSTRFDFDVEVQDLPIGSYDLIVGEFKQGAIAVKTGADGTRGSISFSTDQSGNPPKPPLTFDPRGQNVQIVQGSTVFLSMTFPH